MAKRTTRHYEVTAPDGTVFTRTTESRLYNFVVLLHTAEGWGAWQWSEKYENAAKTAKTLRNSKWQAPDQVIVQPIDLETRRRYTLDLVMAWDLRGWKDKADALRAEYADLLDIPLTLYDYKTGDMLRELTKAERVTYRAMIINDTTQTGAVDGAYFDMPGVPVFAK